MTVTLIEVCDACGQRHDRTLIAGVEWKHQLSPLGGKWLCDSCVHEIIVRIPKAD